MDQRPQVVVYKDTVIDLRESGTVNQFLCSCKGWKEIDTNPDTVQVAVGDHIYQYHKDGSVWIYNGSSWNRIDNNTSTSGIVVSGSNVYQTHHEGAIYKYNGKGWENLDRNKDTVAIAADGYNLYQLHISGAIYKYRGSQGWDRIDNNRDTKAIIAGGGNLYQLHNDGAVYHYNGKSWDRIDGSKNTVEVAAGPAGVFQRHDDGSVWVYEGSGKTWKQLFEQNDQIMDIAVGNSLYARKEDNSIIRYESNSPWSPLK